MICMDQHFPCFLCELFNGSLGYSVLKMRSDSAIADCLVIIWHIALKTFLWKNYIINVKFLLSDAKVCCHLLVCCFCRVGVHFQNGIAEAAIKQLTEKARTMLIHANHRWPDVIEPCLWPFALKQAEFNLNNLRLGKSGKMRAKHFSAMHNKINIRHYHTFGCLVYVLNACLRGAGFIPKWDERVRVGAYVERSPIHAGKVSLLLNLSTVQVSPFLLFHH